MGLRTWLLGKLLRENEVVIEKEMPLQTGGGESEEIKDSEKTPKSHERRCVKTNIYVREGRYTIYSCGIWWGTMDTLSQAEYVLSYLRFKGFPNRLRSIKLLEKRNRGNEYYNVIRRIAREDKKWLERDR